MVITILTLFPEIFQPIFSFSILSRAQKKNLVKIRTINIRDYALDKHKTVDDKPYGGGVGMLIKVDVLYRAIEAAKIKNSKKERIILLDPTGIIYQQKKVRQLIKYDHLILICGHYEGIDYRIKHFIDEKISIGEYILTGGELPAAIITDSVVRLLKGVLEKKEAAKNESFTKGRRYEAPQFTRPADFKGYRVPEILLSGNHQKIKKWRENQTAIRSKK